MFKQYLLLAALMLMLAGFPGQPVTGSARAQEEEIPFEPAPSPAETEPDDTLPEETGTQGLPPGANLTTPFSQYIKTSLDILLGAGWSSEGDDTLFILQGGGHDPRKRGLTVQNVELSLSGAVDPFFQAETHIIYFINPATGASVLELEEAFLTTQDLPWGLQLKAGQFFTSFGRLNARHPHQWLWQDQTLINTRIFGPDGMRGPGLRLSWLTPLPWFSEVQLGVQNAGGETMRSFLSVVKASEEAEDEHGHAADEHGLVGGLEGLQRRVDGLEDFAWLLHWNHYFDISADVFTKFGISGLWGPNPTGLAATTKIYGADFLGRWLPADNEKGWPFLTLEGELLVRDYENGAQQNHLHDWGFYSQVLYGFLRNWSAGVRYEYATGAGEGPLPRARDPFRADRHRFSPMLVFQPSEFSRLRLQYNFDWFEALNARTAHSLWLGVEFLIGDHPPHEI